MFRIVIFLKKNLFHFSFEIFWKKIKKLWTLDKLENMTKKSAFSSKIVFLFLEAFFYKKKKAQKIPEVTGRLVLYSELWRDCITEGTRNDASFQPKLISACFWLFDLLRGITFELQSEISANLFHVSENSALLVFEQCNC